MFTHLTSTYLNTYDFTHILAYIAIILIFLLFLFNSSTCNNIPKKSEKYETY